MKYGTIAGNRSVNAAIYRCFSYLVEEDARLFVRKFREQIADNDQVMHTFRELLVGGFLGSHGVRVRYERAIDGAVPDWSIVTPDGTACALVELVNFHPAKSIEDEIKERVAEGRPWAGWIGSHAQRLYDRIHGKASKYKSLVEKLGLPYVIAVFGEFNAVVDIDDVRECVSEEQHGVFGLYPTVSGALFFEERSARYDFTYLANPGPANPILIPSGAF